MELGEMVATETTTTNNLADHAYNHESSEEKLDAGALFVLKSKGSWLHCGYHLTTAVVAPSLLSLPFAFASLGWAGGVVCLTMAAAVTFYSYNLLFLVLEHNAQLGRRQLRFRDMASDALGPMWGRYYVGAIQFMLCFGAVVASAVLGGQSMKSIYLLSRPDGAIKLYEFVIIFGVFLLVLAQIPSFHSLRHINLVSLILCLAYSACATAGSIHAGRSSKTPPKKYTVLGDEQDRVFGSFNAIAIIAATYGNGIVPEIQATVAPPVTGKMFKGLCLSYTVVVATFYSVAISGYWAFGNQVGGNLLSSFIVADGSTLISKWFVRMTTLFTLLQLAAAGLIYLQPTNDVLEGLFADPKMDQYSARNVVPRLIFRSLWIIMATTIAAMLPFFGDINGFIGAFGCLPLDYALPPILYNITFKPSKRSFIFWLNTVIATVFSALTVLACIAAVRQIALDATNYKLFANL